MNYVTNSRGYDELRRPDGTSRAHWSPFLSELADLSEGEIQRRVAAARALMRDNAVTYNVYDEGTGQTRPWELDIIPLILSAPEWSAIEAGVVQRARLADALLGDIYGGQKLIAEGHLPPHLVVGHPSFLRPLINVAPPGGVRMHLYSADLVRATDGSWVVAALRTDAPSGMGYALENRIAVSQSFPVLFRDMRVQRLAAFFQSFRESVLSLSRADNPRAVLLTPGPYNEAYFEHAYLSHYLGLTLVEGEDLAVRDGEVFLKTLAGLERVDVVFRRVDSLYCDPLDLKPDSALGVPGLVEAARAGGVVLANALGGNVVESPAMASVLPQLCRAMLGEDLKIPDVTTLWCGTDAGRKRALATQDGTIVRKAFDSQPVFSRSSSARSVSEIPRAERARMMDEIERRGSTFVVQDVAPLGLTPTFRSGKVSPQPFMLRVYAAWTPQGYVVMPGGLTRIASDDGAREWTMQSGSQSKDTWVLSEAPVASFTLLPPSDQEIVIRRAGDEAPSRAMDNLMWMGRYAERAENLVRILRSIVRRLGDDAGDDDMNTAADMTRRLLVPLTQTSVAAVEAAQSGDHTALVSGIQSLIFSRSHPHGLQRLLGNVQRTAWATRDRLSLDTWRTVHAFTQGEFVVGEDWNATGAQTYLATLVRRAAALSGLAAENMTRGRTWQFFDMGRRIERATHTAWLVRQTMATHDSSDIARFQIALEIADSSMTYRYRYLNVFQAATVIDLLLLDESNPRAVKFQLMELGRHIASLPRLTPAQARQLDTAILNVMLRQLITADARVLATSSDSNRRTVLAGMLDALDDSMTRFSDAIADAYFQHARRRRSGGMPAR